MYIFGCQQFKTRTTSCKKNNTKEKKSKKKNNQKKERRKERKVGTDKERSKGGVGKGRRKKGRREGRKKIGKRYASNHKTDLPKRDGFAFKKVIFLVFHVSPNSLHVFLHLCTQLVAHEKYLRQIFEVIIF